MWAFKTTRFVLAHHSSLTETSINVDVLVVSGLVSFPVFCQRQIWTSLPVLSAVTTRNFPPGGHKWSIHSFILIRFHYSAPSESAYPPSVHKDVPDTLRILSAFPSSASLVTFSKKDMKLIWHDLFLMNFLNLFASQFKIASLRGDMTTKLNPENRSLERDFVIWIFDKT